jgi:hypothetical protein
MRETPIGIGPLGSVGRMRRAGRLPAHTCCLRGHRSAGGPTPALCRSPGRAEASTAEHRASLRRSPRGEARTARQTRPTTSLALLEGAGTEAELGLLRLRQWLQRRRLHGHDHRGRFWRLRHGHGGRGCGPERDAEGVPMLLRHHAVRERVAARLETVGPACRAGRITGLHRDGTAGESANRGGEDHLFHHLCSYGVEEC